jgi:regulation of enolase protein 1 (concanavalin A-like superfamily)
MIRSSLSSGAAHGFALVSAGKGVAFQRRTSVSGLTTHTAGAYVSAPQWVRLVRSGSTLTSYSSADGVTWVKIASDTVQLGAVAYVGVAVTSHTATALTTASVSNVGLLQAAPGTLPAGQSASDVGSPAIKGATVYNGGQYTIAAAGSDIWGTTDQFHYVYQQASGDVDVTLRVASLAYADQWSKAGVMIRQSLSADSAHGYALASVARGYAFQRRPLAAGASASTAGSTGTPPGWVRLKRTGNLLTAYESRDGVSWTVIGSDTIVLSDPVYVGIAVTSHNAAAATTAVADRFSVTSVLSPVNQVPTVTLTATASAYSAPATISLTALANDPENQMSRVDFYNGSALLASDPTAPYAMTWSNVAAGTYALTAVAYDAAGQNTRSAPVNITVTTATTALPPPLGTTFQASPDHATLTGYRVEVFAAGVNTATGTPLASIDVGKPAPNASNDITVSIPGFFTPLAPGNYQLTVAAVNGSQFTRSVPIAFAK